MNLRSTSISKKIKEIFDSKALCFLDLSAWNVFLKKRKHDSSQNLVKQMPPIIYLQSVSLFLLYWISALF